MIRMAKVIIEPTVISLKTFKLWMKRVTEALKIGINTSIKGKYLILEKIQTISISP